MLAATKVKMSGSTKKVNRYTYNISSIKCLTKKFLEVSRCSNAKQRQINVQKSLLHMQSCFLLITELLIIRAVAEPRNSGKSAKFTKTRKISWNSVEILLAVNLQNLCQNFVTEMGNQRSETTKRRLCCKKLGTSHDVKGFATGSFLERIVVERANDDLWTRKTLKTLVWSAQNWSVSSLKITTKSVVFYQLLSGQVCPEISHKIGQFFCNFVPKNPAKFDFFFPRPIRSPVKSDLLIFWLFLLP